MGRETRGDECSVLFHSTVHSEGEKKQKQDQKDREKWIVKKHIFLCTFATYRDTVTVGVFEVTRGAGRAASVAAV